ncbi:type I-F CRISPR-associated protein Csy2 [Psychrobacter pygoscelis]|uniref:type I-F CRISPR-associated protein Csy2 n=1 Tax=Psychrobacter pygoscelis TaxID=2488563 RepID=UPI0010399686|nr:type I-F CRISPR-associated protein Csy2 [Psychrobacter pygoscelis]
MSRTYILLERIHVQNANCVAGLTFGFPAITHFLGFSHALGLKLRDNYPIDIQGCAVFCHAHESHTYQAKGFGDFTFIQRKASPTFKKHASSSPPIIEEGKMNLCVSLLLSCDHLYLSREQEILNIKQQVMSQANRLKLAGGSITKIEGISVYNQPESADDAELQVRLLKRKLMPSFVLCDRHSVLIEHYKTLKADNNDIDLLEAWLDFSRLTYQAKSDSLTESINTSDSSFDRVEWVLKEKPAKGWLVPIMTGYSAIAPLQEKGEVIGARSPEYPFSFVEAVYSIGEWLSTHRISSIDALIWQYHYEADWYLCRQSALSNLETTSDDYQYESSVYEFNYDD